MSTPDDIKDSFTQKVGKKFGFLNHVSVIILLICLAAMLFK